MMESNKLYTVKDSGENNYLAIYHPGKYERKTYMRMRPEETKDEAIIRYKKMLELEYEKTREDLKKI